MAKTYLGNSFVRKDDYLNSIEFLVNSGALGNFAKISTTFGIIAGSVSQLLNSVIKNEFYFNNDAISTKNLTIQFAFPVWVKEFQFAIDRNAGCFSSGATAQIQGSEDGTAWTNIGSAVTVSSVSEAHFFNASGGQGYIQTFTTPTSKNNLYSYWRINGSSGNTTSSPYVYRLSTILDR